MGKAAIEVAALVVLLIGSILTCIAVFLPYWAKNAPQDTVRNDIIMYYGLWIECTSYSTGNRDCDNRNNLSPQLQGARAFGCTAVASCLLSLGCLIFGMKYSRCNSTRFTQRTACRVAGGFALVAGVSIIIAASWYANKVYQDYHGLTTALLSRTSSVQRKIFGESLFIGWLGGVVLMVAGVIALLTTISRDNYVSSCGYSANPPMYGILNNAVTFTDEHVCT